MIQRATSLSQIKGNGKIISYLINGVQNGTLSHSIMFVGAEGTGKTTIAKLLALEITNATEEERVAVILNNQNTARIITVSKGDDIKQALNQSMTSEKRVVIIEECHSLPKDEQSALLQDLEFLQENVYVIALTTVPLNLQRDFKSRFSQIQIHPVNDKDMRSIIRQRCELNNQSISEQAIEMIVAYAEGKPRAAIMVLEMWGSGETVDLDIVQHVTSGVTKTTLIDLLKMFNKDIIYGVVKINSLPQISRGALTSFLVEVLEAKNGGRDASMLASELSDVSADVIIKFLHQVTAPEFDIVHAFIDSHPLFGKTLGSPDRSVNNELITERMSRTVEYKDSSPTFKPFSLEDIKRQGVKVDIDKLRNNTEMRT